MQFQYLMYGLRDPKAALAYILSSHDGINRLFAKRLMGLEEKVYGQYIADLRQNLGFIAGVSQELQSVGRPVGEIRMQGVEVLYVLVRALKPRIVVETGVAAGVSSAFILRALEDNRSGELISIDLPNYDIDLSLKGIVLEPTSMLPDGKSTGFVIPQNLRHRWHLRVGLSHQLLTDLLLELKGVDLFLHDSEHSYENMMFEYQTSWPYISKNGLLLSHDISLNAAFFDFARSVRRKPYRAYFSSIGGIRN